MAGKVVGMLGSELEGTQPLFLDVGCGGSRLGVGGRRRESFVRGAGRFRVKSFPFMPSFGFFAAWFDVESESGVRTWGGPDERCASAGEKGLAMPGTEKTKLKGNGMVADAEDDGGKQGLQYSTRLAWRTR